MPTAVGAAPATTAGPPTSRPPPGLLPAPPPPPPAGSPIPPPPPAPPGRLAPFDTAPPTLGGFTSYCKGGDFAGDGHIDVIFSDQRNDYWGAGMQQGKLTIIFGGARGVAPPSNFIVGNQNFGGEMAGGNFDVGDFNGDGKADIGTTWNVNAQTYTLFAGGARANQTNTANAL